MPDSGAGAMPVSIMARKRSGVIIMKKQYLVQRQRNEEGPEKEHPALSWTGDFFFIAFMGRLKLMLALQNCPGSLLSVPVSTWRKCGVVKNNNGI